MNLNPDESFASWLVSRKLFARQTRPDVCFDYRIFMAINACRLRYRTYVKKYVHVDLDEDVKRGSFSARAIAFMENYLIESQRYSLKSMDVYRLDGMFLSAIENDSFMREPLLYDRDSIHPASKLLPEHEKLNVHLLSETKEVSHQTYSLDSDYFRVNRLCIYGKLVFIGCTSGVEVHRLDGFLSDKPRKHSTKFVMSLKRLHLIIEYPPNIKNVDLSNDVNLRIIHIRICKFGKDEVLCVCLYGGFVLLYDIKTIISDYYDVAKSKDSAPGISHVESRPKIIIQVSQGSSGIDIYNDDGGLIYIAIAHGGPAVSVLAYHKAAPCTPVSTIELPCLESVTGINFIQRTADNNDYVTLAYSSECGTLTTVKLKHNENDHTLHAHILDIQFFGNFCGLFIPLTRNDFKRTSQFEYLNINYQKDYKKSVLFSIIQDSFILGYHSPIPYSDDLGIGTLTTQISVPVCPLNWQFVDNAPRPSVLTRFTAFDGAGTMTEAEWHYDTCKHAFNEKARSVSPLRSVRSSTNDPLRHFYYGGSENGERFSDIGRQQYESWWNSKIWTTPTWNKAWHANDGETAYVSGASVSLTKHGRDIRTFSNRHILRNANDLGASRPKKWSRLGKIALNYSKAALGELPKSYSELCGYKLEEAQLHIPEEDVCTFKTPTAENSQQGKVAIESSGPWDSPSIYFSEQSEWSIHNHASKVQHLLSLIATDTRCALKGHRLSELNDDYFLVAYGRNLCLVKAHPLLVLSFTSDEIFPMKNVEICYGRDEIIEMSNFTFVCHIPELNCVVVASALGLLSLIRLTQYDGICSFRQEYIFGWERQYSDDLDPRCIDWYRYPSNHNGTEYCGIDNMKFPFYKIDGLDYSYVPANNVEGTQAYAVLYVWAHNCLKRFSISAINVVEQL